MNINPRQMQKMMSRLGMQQQEIDAVEVVIKTKDKEFVFVNPNVSKVNVMGQETWQIVGQANVKEREEFSEDDVKTVVEQTGVSEADAREALKESKGDLAEAIVKLKS